MDPLLGPHLRLSFFVLVFVVSAKLMGKPVGKAEEGALAPCGLTQGGELHRCDGGGAGGGDLERRRRTAAEANKEATAVRNDART